MMKTCTFFGHRTVSAEITTTLKNTLTDLIGQGVKRFYVGNHGEFDFAVARVLSELAETHDITYFIVLAYLPKGTSEHSEQYKNTILPDGVENVPYRFAITYRNKWMIEQSDYVVTYVTHTALSHAAEFQKLAERKKKIVINIGEQKGKER